MPMRTREPLRLGTVSGIQSEVFFITHCLGIGAIGWEASHKNRVNLRWKVVRKKRATAKNVVARFYWQRLVMKRF